ncbi:MAG TPA: DUF6166 domain-containing protein [Candidatus Angelobacter sp.]|nr:DUF6166 domain-containing protein [Candidatus Angelobacter sp.]
MTSKQGTNAARFNAQLRAEARYVGFRTTSGAHVVVQTAQGTTNLRPRLDLIRHSPVGFDWGRSGSGQAQLAVALLAHISADDAFALEHYQLFQHEIIARFPKHRFEITGRQALQMLAFVSMDALEDFNPPGIPKAKRRKLAIVHALMPTDSHEIGIKAQGIGRSTRTAATRALMNLLGKPDLRQRRLTNLQIELSVFNLGEAQNSNPDSLPD